MHGSLPMVLFRFEIHGKIYEAGQWGSFAYFYPWVLINEGMSPKDVDTDDRVGWFRQSYAYMMRIRVTYMKRRTGPGVKPFGRKNDGPTQRRLLFDHKLLMHATNSIAGIVREITHATKPISSTDFDHSC
jgi:hypothetical protein